MKKIMNFGCLMVLSLILAGCSLLQGAKADSTEVPYVETWKEIIYNEDSNNDKKDRGQIFIRWFGDPRGNDYHGMVLYHKLSNAADPTPIIKAWGFRRQGGSGEYDWSETRVAMWLEDRGIWFVGDQGERMRTSRQYRDGKTISVTYTFESRNSSVSKTVLLQERPSTQEQQPYPNHP